ncbi:hypothetical protein SAMD00024442_22_38 [Candidatus Symbiothrix dinenymphae]|nr:hypothetical protein SAMD00024442_22_38 [Candidatus Symbiothrix dinenymphae]
MKDLAKLQAQKFEVTNAISWSDVYDRVEDFFNPPALFMMYFNTIPNWTRAKDIDCKKANDWFVESVRHEITNFHYIKRQWKKNKAAEYDDLYYLLYDDLMVYFNIEDSQVTFLFRKTDVAKVETLIQAIKKFPKRERATRRKPEINLLVNERSGLDTKEMEINKPKLAIEDNYNDDLLPIHETILKRLSKKNDKGLVLLHGKPGTGKTSYIRYLISKTKKDIIFLPPNMAAAITDPGLMSVLIDHPNSIFVIEDAENIIMDRNKTGGSSVSALLNLADGLLSDCLNIQIICSFNTDLSRIDNALLRKGRLIAKYEFLELAQPKAQALSDKLGFLSKIDKPMTLTAIYNQDEADFQPIARRTIGFQSCAVQERASA